MVWHPLPGSKNHLPPAPGKMSPKRKFFLNLLFLSSLGMTLCYGSYLWVARLGWLLYALLLVTDTRYALSGIFFYASFFQPSGFLSSNHLFTIKHFHIALFIAGLARFIRGDDLVRLMRHAVRRSGILAPVLAMIALSLLTAAMHGAPLKAYAVSLNFLSVLICFVFLLALIGDRPSGLRYNLYFFGVGVVVQILIGLANLVTGHLWLYIHFLHNNHLGILSALAFFLIFGCFLTERKIEYRWLAAILSCGLFIGLVGSCTRTAWFSFSIALTVYFVILQCYHHPRVKKIYFGWFSVATLVMAMFLLAMTLSNSFVFSRIQYLYQIFDLHQWRLAIEDTNNFGFFGRFRREQLFDLAAIMKTSPWIGIGFTQRVIGFHGLYFTFFGSTGLVGLVCFFIFIQYICRCLLRKLPQALSSRNFVMTAGILSSLCVWFVGSLMETLFLHFSVWLIVAVAMITIDGKRTKT